jgi:hypothetical protein
MLPRKGILPLAAVVVIVIVIALALAFTIGPLRPPQLPTQALKDAGRAWFEGIIEGNWNRTFAHMVDLDGKPYSEERRNRFIAAFKDWVGADYSLEIGEAREECMRLEGMPELECLSLDVSYSLRMKDGTEMNATTHWQLVKVNDEWKIQMICAMLPPIEKVEHRIGFAFGIGYDPASMKADEREIEWEVENWGNISYGEEEHIIRLFCGEEDPFFMNETQLRDERWYLARWNVRLGPGESISKTYLWTAPKPGKYYCWITFERVISEEPLVTELIDNYDGMEVEIEEAKALILESPSNFVLRLEDLPSGSELNIEGEVNVTMLGDFNLSEEDLEEMGFEEGYYSVLQLPAIETNGLENPLLLSMVLRFSEVGGAGIMFAYFSEFLLGLEEHPLEVDTWEGVEIGDEGEYYAHKLGVNSLTFSKANVMAWIYGYQVNKTEIIRYAFVVEGKLAAALG